MNTLNLKEIKLKMDPTDKIEVEEIGKKILVMGLENSGKTSIILNILGKDNLLEYIKINPTKGYDIKSLKKGDLNFILWDLGGQDNSIKEYLDNFKNYITDTEELFFVIDIQDMNKYNKALSYFKKIIDNLKLLNIKVEVTVFLHKNDHDLYDKFPDINKIVIDNLISRIKELIPTNYYYEIYKTTIYTVLDKVHIY
ncbi:MAG: ADP-ribosylation factor-like protein [Promethearchaeota archaeon]